MHTVKFCSLGIETWANLKKNLKIFSNFAVYTALPYMYYLLFTKLYTYDALSILKSCSKSIFSHTPPK
jgi:hypothetical protein